MLKNFKIRKKKQENNEKNFLINNYNFDFNLLLLDPLFL